MSTPAPAPIRIATRGSALALAQANLVLAQAQAALPGQLFELRVIKTTGDKLQTASLANPDLPKGLFTKEIEEALLRGEADLAVHSLKDLPTQLPPGLLLGATPLRADVRDVLLFRDQEFAISHVDPIRPVRQDQRSFRPSLSILALPYRATVATSSTRRTAQLLERRPDLNVVPIRGNVGTRLLKLTQQAELDAIVLAAAGLARLNFQINPAGTLVGEGVPPGIGATPLTLAEMLPCVGQAAIGLEVREGDTVMAKICQALNHQDTYRNVLAERAFLSAMGGGCQLAVAAFAERKDDQLHLRGISFLGGYPIRGEVHGPWDEPEALGRTLATQLKPPAR